MSNNYVGAKNSGAKIKSYRRDPAFEKQKKRYDQKAKLNSMKGKSID